jgi:alpha-beta hydrolase superfamily lysophospholipase
MNHAEGTRLTPSGSSTYYRRWWPAAGSPRAALLVVHGFGEHSDLYQHLAAFFVERGYAVFALDLRGHGRSGGARGFIRRWEDYREDVHTLMEIVGETAPGIPVFLVGHSMGGLIVIEYALHYPDALAGVVAMGPALGDIGVSPFLLRVSRMLSRIWPGFGLDTGLDSDKMSRDPKVVERLDADPMTHGRGTARLGTEVVDTIARVRQRAGDLTVPILLQHGEADQVALPDGTRWFFERITSPDKELKTYPGGYHNLFVDLNWKEVLEDIHGWISPRIEPGSAGPGD